MWIENNRNLLSSIFPSGVVLIFICLLFFSFVFFRQLLATTRYWAEITIKEDGCTVWSIRSQRHVGEDHPLETPARTLVSMKALVSTYLERKPWVVTELQWMNFDGTSWAFYSMCSLTRQCLDLFGDHIAKFILFAPPLREVELSVQAALTGYSAWAICLLILLPISTYDWILF